MLENLCWQIFKRTGNIETFLEYTKIKEMNYIDERNKDFGNNN